MFHANSQSRILVSGEYGCHCTRKRICVSQLPNSIPVAAGRHFLIRLFLVRKVHSLSATGVIKFWFEEIDRAQRFKKDPEFDELIRSRFLELHMRARKGLLYAWRDDALDALAEVILLDQFSRNLFRDSAEAFAYDELALVLSQEAIRQKFDEKLDASKRAFLYMPFMHSESAEIHKIALYLFDRPGLEDNYNYELRHKAIIDRFGRYPHRNDLLGRESTSAELEFLAQPGSSF